MNKFDLSGKIKLADLLLGLMKKNKITPYRLFKKSLGLRKDWQENYFSWGRSALYYLFKRLKFKKITFPAFTCPTLIEAAEKAGKEVILTEVDLDTFNLDINKIPLDG